MMMIVMKSFLPLHSNLLEPEGHWLWLLSAGRINREKLSLEILSSDIVTLPQSDALSIPLIYASHRRLTGTAPSIGGYQNGTYICQAKCLLCNGTRQKNMARQGLYLFSHPNILSSQTRGGKREHLSHAL